MELVSFAKEMVQSAAEQLASCRLGQTALRQADRALWVVEKCARWAVPPPLDQDDRPQPELVRPLPWVFFLAMLITLRVTRESISLINLVLGKPPLRSADVVMYIQSKRRYLRTLKYQGNRMIRARSAPGAEPWYSRIQALFEFTMCFRRSQHYGNNNTTTHSNNDQVLVVRRSKRTREAGAAAAAAEATMERLIEKMMVDLDADSDDDSSFTLTNATSMRSDGDSGSDQESTERLDETTITSTSSNTTIVDDNASPKTEASATPVKTDRNSIENDVTTETNKVGELDNGTESDTQVSKESLSQSYTSDVNVKSENESLKSSPKKTLQKLSPKEETQNFIQGESCAKPQLSLKQSKFANGRAMSVPNKKKGLITQRRDTDIPLSRTTADKSF